MFPSVLIEGDFPIGQLTILVSYENLCVLVGRFVSTKVISVGNEDQPWFNDDWRHTFDIKLEAHLQLTRDRSRVNWGEFVLCKIDNESMLRRVSV